MTKENTPSDKPLGNGKGDVAFGSKALSFLTCQKEKINRIIGGK
ncbi:hypothetical protein [Pseudogracilibacillus auburnensis]|nr:hypothetical protein [Pseudogracilibacillus auburnensis]